MNIKNEALVKKMEKTGFTEREALVYVSLLELGGAYPSKIAQYCGLKRATTYDVLTTLSIRGFINEIEKRNKLFYQIEKPEKILGFFQNQAAKIEESIDKTRALIPEISGLFGLLKYNSKVTYYEGLDGWISMYEDKMNEKKPYEMVGFSKTGDITKMIPEKVLEKYVKSKAKLGVTSRALVPDTPENKKYFNVYLKNVDKKFCPKARYIDPAKFGFNGEITVYGESKIAIMNFNENRLIGVIIEDKNINQMMRTAFELAWDSRSAKE